MSNFYYLDAAPENLQNRQGRPDHFVSYPFRIPGVTCCDCGNTWASCLQTPVICPPEFRAILWERQGWPLPVRDHFDLRLDMVNQSGVPIQAIPPGSLLMPAITSPLPRNCDYFISDLFSIIVSNGLKKAFEQAEINGPQFFAPIVVSALDRSDFDRIKKKVGTALLSADHLDAPEDCWELVVPAARHLLNIPPEVYLCRTCQYSNSKEVERRLVRRLMDSHDLIRVGRRLIGNERVKNLIERSGFSNLICERPFV